MNSNSDDVVISGISCRFPQSRNVEEFKENLFNKIDMIDAEESRWKNIYSNVPPRFGKTIDLEKFDSNFFLASRAQADAMDPQMRTLLEHSYECILDAGISPQSLIGSNTAVIVACSNTDAKDSFLRNLSMANHGLKFTGTLPFYLANRISYTLGLCGPSFVVDLACASSALTLDIGYKFIQSGACDAAIIGGCQLMLDIPIFQGFSEIGALAADGFSRPFDKNATGFVCSDTVGAIFLQKRKDSKRIYANVIFTRSNNDGFKQEGQSLPSKEVQAKLLTEFYEIINFDPCEIKFLEAHATGTILGDFQEISAIDEVFCKDKNRSDKLKVGSVKSNMGHSIAASALASIAKIIIAFENQKFPANINFINLRDDVAAFNEHRIEIPTDSVDLTSDYIAMNSSSIGGSNVHILFKQNERKKKNFGLPNDDLERIVLWSGRTEEAINAIYNDIEKRSLDAEHVGLLQNSQILTPNANSYRGYRIFKKEDKAKCIKQSIEYFNGVRRPVVFVYSGVGSQWHKMGRDLMKIPLFAESINKCHEILIKNNVDLKGILFSSDENIYDSMINSYFGILSIAIALTDVLKTLGIQPDFLIGHSVGEVGVAYADGCLTMEEVLTVAILREKLTSEFSKTEGAMAVVGMHHSEVEKILPSKIDIACLNSAQSTTISGPKDDVCDFIKSLLLKKVFVREIPSTGIAFHSRYIQHVGEKFHQSLLQVLTNPKKRSSKWISSSYAKGSEKSQLCDARYFADNLTNQVHFEEAMEQLPKNVIAIEISPHGLFKGIIKSSLSECTYIELANKSQSDGKIYFLEQLGRLFQGGIDMNIAALYPAVEFPVSRGTPMISPLIKWNHQENFNVEFAHMNQAFERFKKIINLSDQKYEFLKHHIIDGKKIIPGSFWIHLIWESFGFMHGIHYENLKVIFENLEFLRAVPFFKNREIIVTVMISHATGRFEIIESEKAVFTGRIYRDESFEINQPTASINLNTVILKSSDFYKLAQICGYNYGEKFRGIEEIRSDGLFATIKATNNWTILIDVIFQCEIIRNKGLFVPQKISKIAIDPIRHREKIVDSKLQVVCSKELSKVFCGGIEFGKFKTIQFNRTRDKKPIMEIYKFIPFIASENDCSFMIDQAIRIVLMSNLNIRSDKYTFVEIDNDDEIFSLKILSMFIKDIPVNLNLKLLTSKDVEIDGVEVINGDISFFNNVDAIFKNNCLNDCEFLRSIENVLSKDGILVAQEDRNVEINCENLNIISQVNIQNDKILVLAKFRKNYERINYQVIEITTNVGEWLEPLKKMLKYGNNIIMYSQQDCTGILGFFKSLCLESTGKLLKCFVINDKNAPKFDINDSFYETQIAKDYSINILKNGVWGSYVHLELKYDEELKQQRNHVYLNYLKKGDLTSLKWLQGTISDLNSSSHDLVKVQYSSLNFKDVIHALGYIDDDLSIHQQCSIGFEFAGIKMKTNERVMGMMMNSFGGFSTYIQTKDAILFKIPSNWTFEDAATVPVIYTTVYYSFFIATKVKEGKSILIHSGAGGVGQAALHIAFAYGLEVFTTVGTEEKRKFLLENFPQLKAENIGNSRDLSFEKMIMTNTKGKGVDYVLNSLSGDKLKSSIRCLGKNGVFLEIGRYDVEKGTEIDMEFLMKNIAIKLIRIDKLDMSSDVYKPLIEKMQDDINSGIIKPINRTVFDASNAEKAFRFITTGNHIGKVLLKIRQNEQDEESLPINVQPRLYCDSKCSFVIVGGLGGLGLELCEWLIMRGCKKLVISSRRGISNQYQAYKLNIFKLHGVEVIISTDDVTTESGCEKLLMKALKLGPIEGIINTAAILNDAIFINQSEEMFNKTLASKSLATKHLHELSFKYCPKLKHFVVFSSITSGHGNISQTNYAMANSVMEEIIEMRHEMNLPAKAIQWGPVKDIGLLSHTQSDNFGILSMISIATYLKSLDNLFLNSNPIVGCFGGIEKSLKSSSNISFIDTFMAMFNITDQKSISMSSTLTELGIDSIASIEVQQYIQKMYGIVLTSLDLRTMTLFELDKKINEKLACN